MNPRYVRGRKAEWKSRDLLVKQGYTVVRAAGSKGAYDLVAWNTAETVLVQVKCDRWPTKPEVEALVRVPTPPGGRKLIHRWDYREAKPYVREVWPGWRPGPREIHAPPTRGVIDVPSSTP